MSFFAHFYTHKKANKENLYALTIWHTFGNHFVSCRTK